MDRNTLIALTADVVRAHVSFNQVDAEAFSQLIVSVHDALAKAGQPAPTEQSCKDPAVNINASVTSDGIICLDCGSKWKMLKRHISSEHNMSPDAYRKRWNLSDNYPLVAPAYSEQRRAIALDTGFAKTA